MKIILLFILHVSPVFAAGTVYFDTRTNQILGQSVDYSLIGTSTTNISTAPITFPLQLGSLNFWDGSKAIPATPAVERALSAFKLRREIWQLQLLKAQSAGDAAASEVLLINRDIELLQRRVVAIQAGR